MNLTQRTLRYFIHLFFAAMLVGAVPQAVAEAYFAPEEVMIKSSEAIAIVDISRVEKVTTKGTHFHYGEIAHANVQQTIKGKLPETIKLYGDESFICAQVSFTTGRYLVFLRCDGDLLVGSNWYLSVRPIKDTLVEWFSPGDRHKLSWQPLATVLTRINTPDTKSKTK